MRVLLVLLASALVAAAQPPAADPVSALQQRIDAGQVTLEFDAEHGYLPAVLAALKIPVSSQGLVFSRTSLQVDRIAPWSPRALYFNDDVYVGWVQGGPIMEIAAVDPAAGAVFYTLSQERTGQPRFHRESRTCLQCHQSATSTRGVPGFIMRSVISDRHGYPVSADAGATTDSTPLGRRWGGWYVTGGLGALPHMGNTTTPALKSEMGNVDLYLARTPATSSGGLATATGAPKFDATPYLSPHSDAVALLVLAHQTSVHNLIARARAEALKFPEAASPEALALPVRGAADQLLRALRFEGEAAYPGRITGSSAFAEEFAASGRRDRHGRSLRDFDLERRLFRYPLSYLIYSDAFDALPSGVKRYLSQRLRDVLTGEVREIVADTRPELLQ